MLKREFTNEDIRGKYDSFSRFYDFVQFPFEIIILARLRRKLLRDIYGKVLEIAIGSGRNLRYYNKDCKIIGIDFSPKMLEIARQKARKLGTNADFYVGNAEKLRFEKGKFDFIVDSLGLCTYPNPIKALKEMARVCKKSGKILLLEHGISNTRFFSKFQYWRDAKHHRAGKVGCSLIRNHEEIVKKAGLKIKNIERHLFGIFYVIIARP